LLRGHLPELEAQKRAELVDARLVGLRCDLAEGGARPVGAWRGVDGVIEHVDRLGAHLQLQLLKDGEVALYTGIEPIQEVGGGAEALSRCKRGVVGGAAIAAREIEGGDRVKEQTEATTYNGVRLRLTGEADTRHQVSERAL
jgi:hypothetical protein